MQDDDLFASEMSGVKPLNRDPRERLVKTDRTDSAVRRQAAVASPSRSDNKLTDDGIPPLDAWYVLEFKRPGIQNGVYRKLRLGQYQTDARLDLHRLVVKQAREEVFAFIRDASELGLRNLLIVHGKGQSGGPSDRKAVLKGYVNHWLRELDAVQAFHSAQPAHGGTGSVYVLLKKSSDQKRENRLKYMKGRVQD